MNYQKPLLDHAWETVSVFEKECVSDLSECLENFFGSVDEAFKGLLKKEVDVVRESIDVLLSYKRSKRWCNKAIDLILTVIASFKNFVSDCLDKNPLIKAGLELLEEAMKLIKK